MRRLLFACLLLGCPSATPDGPAPDAPEPLDLPADPAAPGAPVGVTTMAFPEVELTLEVWYPAPDATGTGAETVDFNEFVPASVQEHLGVGALLPVFSYDAVRDAPLRRPVEPYPVVIFSHGFGGARTQSVDLARHLASRGYVVLSADHPGRMLGDILPCIFTPVLEGCDLSGFGGDDPAEWHVRDTLRQLETLNASGMFAGALDLGRVGLSGHSAGGRTTATIASQDDRVHAALVLALAEPVTADLPTAYLEGSCDFVATGADALAAADEGVPEARVVELRGAGHLAFSNMCSLELGRIAEEVLEPRDDLNPTFYDSLIDLATSGCAGGAPPEGDGFEHCADAAWMLPEDAFAPIHHYATAFFDDALRGTGPGVQDGVFADVTVLR